MYGKGKSMKPATIYEVYAEELKRALISDSIKVLKVYGDNGECVEFVRRENDADMNGEGHEQKH